MKRGQYQRGFEEASYHETERDDVKNKI